MPQNEPTKVEHWPGSGSLLDSVPEGWHTSAQAARKVGRSKDTIIRWRKEGTYVPSGFMELGQLTILLYSDHDIVQMLQLTTEMKPGRKKETEHAENS